MSRSVVQFISDERAAGKSESEITHMLLNAGWHMDIIHKAMHSEPVRQRSFEPILDIKKQPYRKTKLIILLAVTSIIVGMIYIFYL